MQVHKAIQHTCLTACGYAARNTHKYCGCKHHKTCLVQDFAYGWRTQAGTTIKEHIRTVGFESLDDACDRSHCVGPLLLCPTGLKRCGTACNGVSNTMKHILQHTASPFSKLEATPADLIAPPVTRVVSTETPPTTITSKPVEELQQHCAHWRLPLLGPTTDLRI